MPNNPQIFVFDFEGNLEIAITTQTQSISQKIPPPSLPTNPNIYSGGYYNEPPVAHTTPTPGFGFSHSSGSQSKPEASTGSTLVPDIGTIIHNLNDVSEQIAGDIQHEIRTVLPRCSVQADIFFYEGSLIVVGSVILTFLLPVLTAAVQKELEQQFAQIIEFAIKRVLRRKIKEVGAEVTRPIELDVSQSSASVRDEPTNPSVNQSVIPQYFILLMTANTVLLLFVLILLVLSILKIIP